MSTSKDYTLCSAYTKFNLEVNWLDEEETTTQQTTYTTYKDLVTIMFKNKKCEKITFEMKFFFKYQQQFADAFSTFNV
jgi:hypothetical protein